MITIVATATQTAAAEASTPAATRRPGCRTASHRAIITRARPICSWQSAVRVAQTPSVHHRASSAAQMQNISSGAASVAGWKSKSVANWSGEYRR